MRLTVAICLLLGLAGLSPSPARGEFYVFPPAGNEGNAPAPTTSAADADAKAEPVAEDAGAAERSALPASLGKLELQTIWSPGGERELRCTATLDEEYEEKTLACAELHEVGGGELLGPAVLEFRDTDWPIAMFPLAEVGGRLLTVWSTGSSYRVRVFAWQGDGVRKVLEESCQLFPEILYDRTGKEVLLLTDLEEIRGKRGEAGRQVPGKTRTYRWQESGYALQTVPWGKRLATVQGWSK